MPLSSLVIHRALHAGAFAAIVGVMAVTPLTPVDAQKGKTPTHQTVTVDFAAGGALVSDGGPYPGAQVNVTSGDLRLDLGALGRSLQVNLGVPDSTGIGITDAPSNVSYSTNEVLFIENILGVGVNDTAMRVGRLGLGSTYDGHALGFRYTTNQGITIYGTPVCVTRVSPTQWSIAASCGALESSDIAGLFQDNLKGKINHRFKATYEVPFSLTVTCTAACSQ